MGPKKSVEGPSHGATWTAVLVVHARAARSRDIKRTRCAVSAAPEGMWRPRVTHSFGAFILDPSYSQSVQ